MGIFYDNIEQDNSVIWALQVNNTEDLPALLEDEENLALLRADDEEEYLDWHIVRSVFPEGEEVFRYKLASGNEVLRLLAAKEIYIDGIGPDIDGWSLVDLSIEDGEEKVCWEIMKGALWLAPSPEALKLMLAEGGAPRLRDSFGHSALHYLAEHPNDYFRPAEMIRILLAKGTYKAYEISNALHAALWSIDRKRNGALVAQVLADEFVKRGLTLDESLEKTLAAICKYAYFVAKPFVEEMSAFLKGESKLSSSELELMAATFEGDTSAIDEALSRKPAPNVNAQTGDWKFTPLMMLMMRNRNIEALRRLLKAGADPNLQDKDGCSALFLVSIRYRSDVKLAELLIENGADPTLRNIKGETPFTRIFTLGEIGPGSIILAQLFMDNGADVDTINEYGRTPLGECCVHPEKDLFTFQMCRVLLDYGAFPNVQDDEGKTPLMYLAASPDARLIRDLINYGADTAMEDKFGSTALSIFLDGETRDPHILEMLTHKGAFIGSNDSDSEADEEQDTNDLLLKAIRDYDVEGVRRILADEELWITLSEELCWHFVINNVPEPEAGDFRARLNRGAEILRLLHEEDEDIPVEDYKGRELSYIAARWNRYVDGYETEPGASDDVSLYRHAASPMALREIMTNDEPEEPSDDDEDDDLFDEKFMARASRMFSPEDFVTREEVRNSFTPEDFIDDYSEYEDDNDNNEGNTNILHILAEYWGEYYDTAGMMRIAIEHGADVHAKNEYGATPLALAVGSVPCSRVLLDAGVSLDEDLGGSEHRTMRDVLNLPEYSGPAKSIIAMYIEVMRTILCGRGRANDDLLASVNGHDARRIHEALAQGADVNVRTQKGYTPLMIAVILGNTQTVSTLLENGADVNAADVFGNVAAAFAKDEEILRLLMENGADINKPNNEGKTPVAFAAENEDYMQVKVLLKAGADPAGLKEAY